MSHMSTCTRRVFACLFPRLAAAQQRSGSGHNHSKAIVAFDFLVVITATFRTLYVFVVMEIESRRVLHHNVTGHPTAEWTLQQFREALPGDPAYRFVIHDRDRISLRRSIRVLPIWVYEFSGRRCDRRRRTRYASGWAGAFVGSVSTC